MGIDLSTYRNRTFDLWYINRITTKCFIGLVNYPIPDIFIASIVQAGTVGENF